MTAFRTVDNAEDRRWLRWLDAECFPYDDPVVMDRSLWTIAWEGDEPVAFCGWKPWGPIAGAGFHVRAGVIRQARGAGLQSKMIELREMAMKDAGLSLAVTYTETYSAASMRTLISCGYRPYAVTANTALAPADRWKRMVHWKRELI